MINQKLNLHHLTAKSYKQHIPYIFYMGPKKHNNKNKHNHNNPLPFVSICTPTFNRRPFVQSMIACFKNQTYPKERMEWIIVDDGTDKIEDVIMAANIPQIKYFKIDQKMTLGAKRNLTHTKTKGSILVYMDDDDYYPPERVAHAVERLQGDPKALCAGSSEIYVFFKHIMKMYQSGPYGPTHSTAGTFAFKRELLNQTKYNEKSCLAEEREFLKNYTIPFVQLDPLKTILVFSHTQNTFDKKRLLENPNKLFTESSKKVSDFIKFDYEKPIEQYFLVDIDRELEKYAPGDTIMKPDVLKQIKELEIEREKMKQEHDKHVQIMMQRPGEQPRALNNREIIDLVESQKQEIELRGKKIEEMIKSPMYEELDKRNRKIQVLDGLLLRLREEMIDKDCEIKRLEDEVKTLRDNDKLLQEEVNLLRAKNNSEESEEKTESEEKIESEEKTESKSVVVQSKVIPEVHVTIPFL